MKSTWRGTCAGDLCPPPLRRQGIYIKGKKRSIATHTRIRKFIYLFISRLRGRVRRALDKAERRRERLDLAHPISSSLLPWTEVICACADFRLETADFGDRFSEGGGGGEEEEMVVGVFRWGECVSAFKPPILLKYFVTLLFVLFRSDLDSFRLPREWYSRVGFLPEKEEEERRKRKAAEEEEEEGEDGKRRRGGGKENR